MKTVRIGKAVGVRGICEICKEQPDAQAVRKAFEEYQKYNKCAYCGKSFELAKFFVTHEILDSRHFKKWHVESATSPTRAYSQVSIDKPKKVTFVHPACLKKAFPYWKTTVYTDYTPDVDERLASMAAEMASRAADKVISKGLHLKALASVKETLHASLTGLLKNVSGSSSEFGCPCASRVSNTLSDIADKFQHKASK